MSLIDQFAQAIGVPIEELEQRARAEMRESAEQTVPMVVEAYDTALQGNDGDEFQTKMNFASALIIKYQGDPLKMAVLLVNILGELHKSQKG